MTLVLDHMILVLYSTDISDVDLSDNDAPLSDLFCAACNKMFKSDNA